MKLQKFPFTIYLQYPQLTMATAYPGFETLEVCFLLSSQYHTILTMTIAYPGFKNGDVHSEGHQLSGCRQAGYPTSNYYHLTMLLDCKVKTQNITLTII
jgi:hypothetical protein